MSKAWVIKEPVMYDCCQVVAVCTSPEKVAEWMAEQCGGCILRHDWWCATDAPQPSYKTRVRVSDYVSGNYAITDLQADLAEHDAYTRDLQEWRDYFCPASKAYEVEETELYG